MSVSDIMPKILYKPSSVSKAGKKTNVGSLGGRSLSGPCQSDSSALDCPCNEHYCSDNC